MAKRGRQKNRTGNSKRPPAPSLEGATATKLSSVKPEPMPAEEAEKPSARLQLVPNEGETSEPPPVAEAKPASVPPPPSGKSKTAEPEASTKADSVPPVAADGTPSPTTFDVASDDSALAAEAQAPEQVDEFEESFFSSFPADLEGHVEDDDEPDARMSRLHAPEVVARRDRMRKRVAWGLAACAAVFFVAVGRAALAPHDAPRTAARVETPAPEQVAPAAVKPEPVVQAAAPVVAPEPVAAPVVSAEPTPSVVAVASAAPVASAVPEPVAAPVAPVVSAAPVAAAEPAPVASAAPAVAGGDAKALRAQARKLLESGKANAAIEPAQQSTTIEPEHAEGWLLLGASYLERGRNAEARQAFQTCVTQAKRGPRGECAAMLR